MTWKAHLRNIAILTVLGLAGLYWYLSTPDTAKQPIEELVGPAPKLKDARSEAWPTVKIAKITGWKAGETPAAAQGLAVKAFAQGLDHPRWLLALPNGDVLVAESSAPARETKGIVDWIGRKLIADAGGLSKSADRITLLRDTDGDGVADLRTVLVSGLRSPFGMAVSADRLYVGNTDSVVAFPFTLGQTKIEAKPEKLFDLPAGAPNNHWTRNIAIRPDGKTLLVAIGSHGNIAEGGLDKEKDRAQIKEYMFETKELITYAYGLRNPVGMAFNPVSGTPWVVVNERDMLGSDGPPDYLTTVDFGTFYGWPFTYWGIEDSRVPQVRQDLRQYTKRPDYALGPHVAALGLAFNTGTALGDGFARGAFVGLHGSWNRVPASGYKVVYVPFNERGFPTGSKPVDVLSGFLTPNGDARGRPAGVVIDPKGALLIADDAGNTVWRVTKAG